jgi:hypothetical protein
VQDLSSDGFVRVLQEWSDIMVTRVTT